MAHIVKCRVCKQHFDIDKEEVEWIMPSTNYYYHTSCYTTWKNSSSLLEEEWRERIYDFLKRDMKMDYDYFLCEGQRKNFNKQGMNNKGIFFALKYFYHIRRNTIERANNGIGIVPYIYEESRSYWREAERKQNGLLESIERQMRERAKREPLLVKKKKKEEKQVNLIDLADI